MKTKRAFWFAFLQGKLSMAMLLSMLLLAAAVIRPPAAFGAVSNYYCNNTSCYGINDWFGDMNGAKTTIYTVPLSCSGCSTWYGQETGSVANEMWVLDKHANNPNNWYWVQAGYSTFSGWFGSTTVNYFWADMRPGYGFYAHELSQVPATDYWEYTNYSIARASSTSFRVDIYNGFDYSYTSYSTNDTMSPNDINIGQLLYGTSGASAPTSYFINNMWIGTDYRNTPHYQSGDGLLVSENPPYAGYTVPPHQSQTGGVIYTHCC